MTKASLWRDNPQLHPYAGPQLSGHRDVVVAGGGLTGLTTGALLARAGFSVLVIEALNIGAGATGGSTAKISLLQGTTLSQVEKKNGIEAARMYVDANREGQAWLLRFCQQHDVPTQRRTAYTYAVADGVRKVEHELAATQRAGLGVEEVATPELPFDTRLAIALQDQAQVNPMDVAAALLRDLQTHGGELVEGVRVRDASGHHPIRVQTSHGSLTADTLILATNMPFLDRSGFFARAAASRSYLAAMTCGSPPQGMYLSADRTVRSLRSAPTADGELLLVGGNGHPTGRARDHQQNFDELAAWGAEHFGALQPVRQWSAQDYTTASHLPYAGRLLPARDDIWVAGGYAKWGMTNAVAAGLAVCGAITGGHTPWAEAFQPWRGRLGGAPKAAQLNAQVGLHMAEGWLSSLHPSGPTPTEGSGSVAWAARRPTATSNVDGKTRQVSAICTHLGGILRWNNAECSWDCPLHGSRFAPDGSVLEGPAVNPLRRLDGKPARGQP